MHTDQAWHSVQPLALKHICVPAPPPESLIETSAWGSALGDPDAVGLWPILRNPGRALSVHGRLQDKLRSPGSILKEQSGAPV